MEVGDQPYTFATLALGKELPISIGQEAGWAVAKINISSPPLPDLEIRSCSS